MRRILLMLPVLALVACQTDVPTAIDEEIQLKGEKPDITELTHPVMLVDAVVDSESDPLQFYVKNPGYGMPPCVPNTSRWLIEGVPQDVHEGNFLIREHYLTASECGVGSSWPLYTKDYVRDFAFSVDGGTVCDALQDGDAKRINVQGWLVSAVVPETAVFKTWFRIQCPYLE